MKLSLKRNKLSWRMPAALAVMFLGSLPLYLDESTAMISARAALGIVALVLAVGLLSTPYIDLDGTELRYKAALFSSARALDLSRISSWQIVGRHLEFAVPGCPPETVGVGLLDKRQLSELQEALDALVERAQVPSAV